ncbi:MAG: hypothetical protein Q8W44_08775 [Candidatus Palauibacterales bacterium]|nr:hypothetical protein [Candidatus Palauibacterales bacterium]
MDALTRIVDASFQEQEDGSVAFFPFGAAGDAYRIESPDRYHHIRGFVRRFLVHVLPAVVAVTLTVTLLALWSLGGSVTALLIAAVSCGAVVLACGVYYRTKVRRLVAGLETCDARVDVERYLWFPTAFPELYEMHLWAGGFAAAALVGLMLLFPDLDDGLTGLLAGAIGLTVAWVRQKRFG